MSCRLFYQDLLRQAGGSWFDFEGLIRDIYVACLKPGDWVVDAGAHKGTHTFQMAQAVAPGGRVIAIEAVPALVEQLKNCCHHLLPLVDFHACGLSHTDGTANFYFAPEVPGLSGLRNRQVLAAHRVEKLTIPITTLDRLCADAAGDIRFVKIDVEGGEYDALRGGTLMIKRHQPVVVFEHSTTSPAEFGYSLPELLGLWSALGYRLYDFFGNSRDEASSWEDDAGDNFLAFPTAFKHAPEIFAVVQATLSKAGIRYSVPQQARDSACTSGIP